MSKAKAKRAAAVVKADDAPLAKRKFETAMGVRVALVARGYKNRMTPPGTPSMWVSGDDRVAVVQRSKVGPWVVVPYPMHVVKAAQTKIDVRLKQIAAETAKLEAKTPKRHKGEHAAHPVGDLRPETKLRVVDGTKTPKNAERARIKSKIVGVMSVESIVKRLDCKVKTLNVMLHHGYVEIVK